MRSLFLAGVLAMSTALPGYADDIIKVKTDKSVSEAIDALESAVGGAGAIVFARVDHAAGAASVGAQLGDAQLLIFSNPALGTPAMQLDPVAGLFLPLKVLAYTDDAGQTWLVYEDPDETLEDLNIPKDAEVIKKMQGALKKLTGAAAG